MPEMDFAEFQQRRKVWEADGSHLMSREDVAKFDAFFANDEESRQCRNDGLIRALAGDYSQYEIVEPMIKGYLGAKKCYDLFDRYNGDASDPKLQQEIKERLMEADLRTGFAMCGKNPRDRVSVFLKECERIANRQTLMQTLEEPHPNAKMRLLNRFKRDDPATAQQKLDEALNKDLEQRVEIAKVLFMNHLGKFQVYGSQQPMEMNENIAEVYTHGGRTMFILPAGANQNQVMDSIQGEHSELSGLQGRSFATHSIKPRTFRGDGSVATEAEELRVKGLKAFSLNRHKGMDASIGGLGQLGPNGRAITADGTNGHMYMHLVKGGKNTCATMLVGFENAGPGKNGRLGHAHGASAKKAGNSAFLSDKSYLGRETGGRVVDLSGLSGEALSAMLAQFEARYREAAMAARSGNTALLNACNELLTGKLMSVGQVKGMLQGLRVSEDQIANVEKARAGHSKAEDYKAIAPEENVAIPMKLAKDPEKRPFRVTECEGLVRPEPPAVMEKPSFWQKLLHRITFWSKNTYVNQYKAYQRALPDRVEAYKKSLREYNSNLTALERGENPGGLRAAYERAIEQAKREYGLPETRPAEKTVTDNAKPVSGEVTEQLENALLDTLFQEVLPGNALNPEQENLREEYRGHIRATEGYRKMILSGEDNITDALNDPTKMARVYADVLSGILDKLEPRKKTAESNEPQINNEKKMNAKENAPSIK